MISLMGSDPDVRVTRIALVPDMMLPKPRQTAA
jgi:hypothetical protein